MNIPKFRKSNTKVITTDVEKPSLFRRDKKQLMGMLLGGLVVIVGIVMLLHSSALTNQFIAVDATTSSGQGNFQSVNSGQAANGNYVTFFANPLPPPPDPTPVPPPDPTPPPPDPTPVPPTDPHRYYFAPATATVANGSNTTVEVRIDPDTHSLDVLDKVTITFDATKLQYVSSDFTGSPFDVDLLPPAITTGSIVLNRGTFGASITADALVVKLTFKALVGSANTTLNVSGNAASGATGGFTNPASGSALISFQ